MNNASFYGYILRQDLHEVRDLHTYSGLVTLLGLTYDTREEALADLSVKAPETDVLEVTVTAQLVDRAEVA